LYERWRNCCFSVVLDARSAIISSWSGSKRENEKDPEGSVARRNGPNENIAVIVSCLQAVSTFVLVAHVSDEYKGRDGL
jgi:hypothetical protein